MTRTRISLAKALATAVLGLVGAVVAVPSPVAWADPNAGASSAMARAWGVNGRVLAIAHSAGKVVIGGDFDGAIGPSGDHLALDNIGKYDEATGRFDVWPVSVDGPINAIAVDGDTAYIGGDFRHVNGELRVSIAAVSLVDGSLLPWAPEANVSVYALAVADGYVYIGGPFTTVTDDVDETNVTYLARLSQYSGTLDRTWSTVPLDAPVRALQLTADGSGIYVGGDFAAFDAKPWTIRLALLSTGATPDVDQTFRSAANNSGAHAPVYAMALSGGTLLLAAGGSGGACTLQNATTGANYWTYHSNGNVVAAAFLGPKAYCGGHFTGTNSFATLSRNKVAEIVTASGQITSWAPKVNSALGVFSLGSSPLGLYLGGDFDKVGSTTQPHFGVFYDTTATTVPSAPENLLARPADSQVLLIWDRPSTDGGEKVTKFKVYRSLGSGPVKVLGTTTELNYLDTTAVNGTEGDPASTYHYYVVAMNARGVSAQSTTVDAIPQAGLVTGPAAPQGFTAVGQFGQTYLTWSAPLSDGGSPVTSYTIQRGTDYATLTPVATVGAGDVSYTDPNVVVGTRYYYRIVATNAIGDGVLSKEIWATPNTGVPGAPSLSAIQSGSWVVLDWVPSANSGASPVTKFTLIRDGVRVANISASIFEYTDQSVQAGHTYAYQIKAQNSNGSSKWSDVFIISVS